MCLNVQSNRQYTCRHVLFNESKFPYPSLSISSSPQSVKPTSNIWLSNLLYLHSSNQPSILGPYVPPLSSTSTSCPLPNPAPTPLHISTPPSSPSSSPPMPNPTARPPHIPTAPSLSSSSSFLVAAPDPIPPIVSNHHPITTRSIHGITKKKLCYKAVLDYTFTEPSSYKVASQYPQWSKAMDEEFSALQR